MVGNMEDVTAVMSVQNAYGVAIDRRDWPALRECFAPLASIAYGRPIRTGSLDDFMDWAPRFHDPLGPTSHQMSTHLVEVRGDLATASCYLHAVLVNADRKNAESIFGVYEDELVRTDQGWRISTRAFRAVWHQTAAAPLGPRR